MLFRSFNMFEHSLKTLLMKDIVRLPAFRNYSQLHNRTFFLIFKYVIYYKSFRSLFFYRLIKKEDNNNRNILKKIIMGFKIILATMEIPYTAEIGGGLYLPHPKCIIIHPKTIIGDNVTIFQGVTLGENLKRQNGRSSPIIGNNVLIGAGAKVLGPVTIGENSMIGANAVVLKDIPKNSVAVGIPAKVIRKVEKSYFELEKESRM